MVHICIAILAIGIRGVKWVGLGRTRSNLHRADLNGLDPFRPVFKLASGPLVQPKSSQDRTDPRTSLFVCLLVFFGI